MTKTAATKKAASKKGAKLLEPETAILADAPAPEAEKRRKKKYTKTRLRDLLDTMLEQFSVQLNKAPLTYSAGDGLKMMQMRENAVPDRPTSVKVAWVEDPKS